MSDQILSNGIRALLTNAEEHRTAANLLDKSGHHELAMFLCYTRLQEAGRATWLLDATQDELDELGTEDAPAWRAFHQLPFPWWDIHPTMKAHPDKPELARTYLTLRRRLLHVARENGQWLIPQGFGTPGTVRTMLYLGDELVKHFHATLDARRLAGDKRVSTIDPPTWIAPHA